MNCSKEAKLKLSALEHPTHAASILFRQSFDSPIPDYPKHFVLTLNDSGSELLLGYVHFTKDSNIYLGGGMCVNTRALKRLPHHIRRLLSAKGGIAYYMLLESVKSLNDCDAIFGYVGHPGAYRIDLTVGFKQTEYPHLIVYWCNKQLSELQQKKLIEKANDVGPF